MNKNAVICGIEHSLRGDGCNEIPVSTLYTRVKSTRGNYALVMADFMKVLHELVSDGLFESFGETPTLTEDSLGCSQPITSLGLIWENNSLMNNFV